MNLAITKHGAAPLPTQYLTFLLGEERFAVGILHVKARFLFPMMPFLCAFAGSFFAAWPVRDSGFARDPLAFTRPRLIVGGLIAALLIVLAFAGPVLDPSCAR